MHYAWFSSHYILIELLSSWALKYPVAIKTVMTGQEAENISVMRNYVQLDFAGLISPINYIKMSVKFGLLLLLHISPNSSTWNFIFTIKVD